MTEEPTERPPQVPEPAAEPAGDPSVSRPQPSGHSSVDEAHEVQTVISYESGRWAVDLIVVFDDGVVRTRIDTFPTKGRAEISARLIKRAAERDPRRRDG